MIKLMKIEFKKNRIINEVLIVLAINFVVALLSALGTFIVGFRNMEYREVVNYHIEQIIELTSVMFAIYGAVLLGEFLISEFREGTIKGLFQYSYSRDKIILSKIISVLVFIFFSLIISYVIQGGLFIATNNLLNAYRDLSYISLLDNIKSYVFATIAVMGFLLIASFIGYKSKSYVITVLSIVLLAGEIFANGILTSNSLSFLYSLIILAIGIVFMIYTLKNVKEIDVN